MTALVDYALWPVAAFVGVVVCGALAGAVDAWLDAHGGGAVAHSGNAIHRDGVLILLAFVPWVRSATPLHPDVPPGVWIGSGLIAFATMGFALPRSLRGALAGIATAYVPVALLLPWVWQFAPDVIVPGLHLAAVLFGSVGGWALGRALSEQPVDTNVIPLSRNAARWASWLGDTCVFYLRRTHRILARAFGWGLGIALVIGVVAAFAEEEALLTAALAAAGLGLLPSLVVGALKLLSLAAVLGASPVRTALAWFVSVAAIARRLTRAIVAPVLIVARFPKALCDTCLLMDQPLASRYNEGERRCSKCGSRISFEGGRGSLVAVFEDIALPAEPRVFVRRARAIVDGDAAVDVTHIRLGHTFAEPEVERLVAFLRQHPPSHATRQIEVFAAGGRETVRPYLRNILADHFSWGASDPLAEDDRR